MAAPSPAAALREMPVVAAGAASRALLPSRRTAPQLHARWRLRASVPLGDRHRRSTSGSLRLQAQWSPECSLQPQRSASSGSLVAPREPELEVALRAPRSAPGAAQLREAPPAASGAAERKEGLGEQLGRIQRDVDEVRKRNLDSRKAVSRLRQPTGFDGDVAAVRTEVTDLLGHLREELGILEPVEAETKAVSDEVDGLLATDACMRELLEQMNRKLDTFQGLLGET